MSLYAVFSPDGLQCLGIYDGLFWPDQVTYGPVPRATKANPNPVAPETSRLPNAAIPAGAVTITQDQQHELVTNPSAWRWDGTNLVPYTPLVLTPAVPEAASLSDWRIGVMLWGRMDGVKSAIDTLMNSGDARKAISAKIADERLQYANSVARSELTNLKDAFGFTQADVDESMWRASQVAKGDLSGIWPVSAKQ